MNFDFSLENPNESKAFNMKRPVLHLEIRTIKWLVPNGGFTSFPLGKEDCPKRNRKRLATDTIKQKD